MKKYLYAVLIICAAVFVSSCSRSSSGGSDSDNGGSSAASYTITVNPTTEGTITASPTASAVSGSTVTLSIAPSSGRALSSLTVTGADGSSVATTPNNDCTSYTFTMPASNVTVSGTFAPGYPITVVNNLDHSQTTSNVSLAAEGTIVTINVMIARLYHAIIEEKGLNVQTADHTTITATETSAPTEQHDLVYTFTMPGQAVTVQYTGDVRRDE